MAKYEEESEGSSSHSKGPHRDYEVNLRMAQNFIYKVTSSLKTGMKVAIEGTHGLENSVLMISWNPGRYAPMGKWANPVCLHQSHGSFSRALEVVFNDYVRKIEAFEKRHGGRSWD